MVPHASAKAGDDAGRPPWNPHTHPPSPRPCARPRARPAQEGAIVELANIVKKSDAHKAALKAALGALAVLTSSEDKNAQKLRTEGLDLDRYLKEPDERVKTFVQQLIDRVQKEPDA